MRKKNHKDEKEKSQWNDCKLNLIHHWNEQSLSKLITQTIPLKDTSEIKAFMHYLDL